MGKGQYRTVLAKLTVNVPRNEATGIDYATCLYPRDSFDGSGNFVGPKDHTECRHSGNGCSHESVLLEKMAEIHAESVTSKRCVWNGLRGKGKKGLEYVDPCQTAVSAYWNHAEKERIPRVNIIPFSAEVWRALRNGLNSEGRYVAFVSFLQKRKAQYTAQAKTKMGNMAWTNRKLKVECVVDVDKPWANSRYHTVLSYEQRRLAAASKLAALGRREQRQMQPAGAPPAAGAAPQAKGGQVGYTPVNWKLAHDSRARPYWWHTGTRAVRWTKPDRAADVAAQTTTGATPGATPDATNATPEFQMSSSSDDGNDGDGVGRDQPRLTRPRKFRRILPAVDTAAPTQLAATSSGSDLEGDCAQPLVEAEAAAGGPNLYLFPRAELAALHGTAIAAAVKEIKAKARERAVIDMNRAWAVQFS